MVSTFIVEKIRANLIAGANLERGPCGYPRCVTLPWYAILWEQKGVGWMVRDIRDQQARLVL